MKKTEWTMETLDNRSAFMRNIASNTTIKHKNSITEEVLDKIRAEMHEDGCYYLREEWIDEVIDKYKADKEE